MHRETFIAKLTEIRQTVDRKRHAEHHYQIGTIGVIECGYDGCGTWIRDLEG